MNVVLWVQRIPEREIHVVILCAYNILFDVGAYKYTVHACRSRIVIQYVCLVVLFSAEKCDVSLFHCRLLRSKNRDGTYLIRGGSHAGADKVLSVWHIDRCRHYKLFKGSVRHWLFSPCSQFWSPPPLSISLLPLSLLPPSLPYRVVCSH